MSQLGYGQYDAVASPFNYFPNAGIVTGTTIAMQAAGLLLAPTTTVAALTVTLPLNPADGTVAEITNVGSAAVTALTIAAATGDAIATSNLGVPTTIAAPTASATAPSAASTYKYKYSLNGYITGNSSAFPNPVPAVNPRSWFRVA